MLNDRRTMLGELNWIFTAITDTIAWNTLPRGQYLCPLLSLALSVFFLSVKPSFTMFSSFFSESVLLFVHCLVPNIFKVCFKILINLKLTDYWLSWIFCSYRTNFCLFQICFRDCFAKIYWLQVCSVTFCWQKESWDHIIVRLSLVQAYLRPISILCGRLLHLSCISVE